MRNILYIILLSTFVIFSCTKNEIIEKNANSFSILAYDAEISETIGLNIEDIRLDPPKEVNYWSQHFQNPGNNLNNIFSLSSIKDKKKIVRFFINLNEFCTKNNIQLTKKHIEYLSK